MTKVLAGASQGCITPSRRKQQLCLAECVCALSACSWIKYIEEEEASSQGHFDPTPQGISRGKKKGGTLVSASCVY